MKRISVLVISALLASIVLVGCGSSDSGDAASAASNKPDSKGVSPEQSAANTATPKTD